MKVVSKPRDSLVNQTVQTKFWGLTCETGLKYNQRVKKKYCVTKVVLDPDSSKKDDDSKTVSVVVKHDDGEHIIAVLKHGERYESDLNLVFDRENVTFFLKGNGTVNIVGYEIVEPEENSSENSDHSPKVGKSLKVKSGSPSDAETSGKSVLKSGKKALHQDDDEDEDEDEEESPAEYMNLLGDDLENSSDEEDEDFSLGDEMMNDEDDEDDDDDDVEDEDLELDSDEESDDDEDDDDDEEDIDKPGPSTPKSQKRRNKLDAEKLQKRRKMDDSTPSTSKANHSVSQPDSSEDDSIQEIPVQSKKKAKKLKKKAQEMNNVSETVDKTPNGKNKTALQSKILEGGVEVTDLKVGHGPEARKGKFLHVFYVGRLPNKEIFDAVLPGKKPFGFRLGKQEVIKGWEVGLEGMKVGGKRRIKVPPQMGYGKKGVDKIPPNSTLVFTIDLQHVS